MKLFLSVVVFLCANLSFGFMNLKARVTSHLSNPASVTHSPEENCFYISNINGNPKDRNNNGFITRLSIDEKGKIHTEVVIKGGESDIVLNAPKGIYYFRGQLFIADIDTLRIFSQNKLGKWEAKRYVKIPNSQFLNDVAMDRQSVLWFTDSAANCLFELRPPYGKKPRRRFFNQKIAEPIGLELDPSSDKMWVSSLADDIIYNVDLKAHTILKRYRTRVRGLAGLSSVEKNRVAIVDFNNKAYVATFGVTEVVRETINREILEKPSSILYEPISGIILVTELKDNAVSIFMDEKETK